MWMLIQKIDYIYMITDNILVYQINLPAELRGNQLQQHLDKYDEKFLKIIAGFDKNDWMVPSISSCGNVALFGITVRYIKQ